MSDQSPQEPEDDQGEAAGLDLSSLLAGAQELVAAQARAAETDVVGVAGGGTVEVVVSGSGEFRKLTLSPEIVDPDDIEMLEDLILAAINDAMGKIAQLQAQSLGGLDLGNLDLGGLGGLLGGEQP